VSTPLLCAPSSDRDVELKRGDTGLGLYNRNVYLEAFVHKSNILIFPLPTCIAHSGAILFHDC